MDLPHALVGQITAGRAVLVLGAGASIGAKHPEGIAPPIGDGLRDMLSDQFLGGDCKTLPLTQVADYCISETSLLDVQGFIRDLLAPFQPAEFHHLIPEFPWRGIATLNYDQVIERAYNAKGNKHLKPFIWDNQRLNDLLRDPADRLLIKLHGCISRADDPRIPLILTVDQYVQHQDNRIFLFTACNTTHLSFRQQMMQQAS